MCDLLKTSKLTDISCTYVNIIYNICNSFKSPLLNRKWLNSQGIISNNFIH